MSEQMTRRLFVSSGSSLAVLAASPVEAGCKICKLTRLVPSRFIAGLVFRQLAPVVVRIARRQLVSRVLSGSYRSAGRGYGGSSSYYTRPSNVLDESDFDLTAYKTAVITLGIVDYEVYRRKQIKLLIESADTESLKSLGEVKQYMIAEKINARVYGQHLSYPIDEKTSFDDLLSIQYFHVKDLDKQKHIEGLIAATGVKVFDDWT